MAVGILIQKENEKSYAAPEEYGTISTCPLSTLAHLPIFPESEYINDPLAVESLIP